MRGYTGADRGWEKLYALTINRKSGTSQPCWNHHTILIPTIVLMIITVHPLRIVVVITIISFAVAVISVNVVLSIVILSSIVTCRDLCPVKISCLFFC